MARPFDLLAAGTGTAPGLAGPAAFTTEWHGHGAGHQAGNDAGDTAADRHNFGNAVAGKSEQNPTQGSAQDDLSGETAQLVEPHTGLPLIPMQNFFGQSGLQEDDLPEEVPDFLF